MLPCFFASILSGRCIARAISVRCATLICPMRLFAGAVCVHPFTGNFSVPPNTVVFHVTTLSGLLPCSVSQALFPVSSSVLVKLRAFNRGFSGSSLAKASSTRCFGGFISARCFAWSFPVRFSEKILPLALSPVFCPLFPGFYCAPSFEGFVSVGSMKSRALPFAEASHFTTLAEGFSVRCIAGVFPGALFWGFSVQ